MEYQEIYKIIKKETMFLRSTCFNSKRKKLLKNHILVKVIDDKHINGLYTEVSHGELKLHIFFISKNTVEDKIKLNETMRYLLIKAFCKEYFNIYEDESYLFLAMLQFMGSAMKNKYYSAYENSKLCNIVKSVDSFDELQLILALNFKI